jgi:tRNA-dihydrouridine synthase
MKELSCPLSLKVRLGYRNEHELLRLIPIFNQYPFHEIIIHARTGIQIYSGNVNLDIFGQCLEALRHPVIYNGDITTVTFFRSIRTRFSSVKGWMIGRGIVSDPFLLKALRSGTYQSDKKRLKRFHDELYIQNSDILQGPGHLLGKMKELWSFLASSFPENPELLKRILRVNTLKHYCQIVNELFS